MFLECQLSRLVEPRLCVDVRSLHCGDTKCLIEVRNEGGNKLRQGTKEWVAKRQQNKKEMEINRGDRKVDEVTKVTK